MQFTDPLFSTRSLWTMMHGIGLGGVALLGLAAALFHMHAVSVRHPQGTIAPAESRSFPRLMVATATALWLSVLVGTYIVFPLYRAVPPEGVVDLAAYPKSLIQADANNAWLHGVAMEIKEHVPWISAILTTAVAFVAVRHRGRLLDDERLRRVGMTLLTISFALVSIVALLGTLINKFAPLE